MLSFFTKKKQSPDTPPEPVIQGPINPQQNNGTDDFIFVERKPEDPAKVKNVPLYPPMPQYPGAPYPPMQPPISTATSHTAVPYVQGIPFKLAPELSPVNTMNTTQLQVDGILALMTRQMSVDKEMDYNFMLERSIQNETY